MEQPTSNMQPGEPKRNNSKVIGGVIILLILIALGWFMMTKKQSTEVKSDSKGGNLLTEEKTSVKPVSMKELVAANKTQTCTFSASAESGSNEGKVYMAGGKMRADSTASYSGKIMGAHMINDGKYMYSWTDDQKTGAKMPVTAMENMQDHMNTPKGTMETKNALDENAKYSYKCSNWSVDESVFTPPADINFIDPTEMMKGMNMPNSGAGASGQMSANASACAACDQAGESKAQCLAALHCN